MSPDDPEYGEKILKLFIYALVATSLFMAAVMLATALLNSAPANAQDHNHPPQDAALHEAFYSKWLIPNNGYERSQSCCNKQDCYPTAIRKQNGRWQARRREDGAWVTIPDGRLEQEVPDTVESPDYQSHACMPPPGTNLTTVYCATLGTGM